MHEPAPMAFGGSKNVGHALERSRIGWIAYVTIVGVEIGVLECWWCVVGRVTHHLVLRPLSAPSRCGCAVQCPVYRTCAYAYWRTRGLRWVHSSLLR